MFDRPKITAKNKQRNQEQNSPVIQYSLPRTINSIIISWRILKDDNRWVVSTNLFLRMQLGASLEISSISQGLMPLRKCYKLRETGIEMSTRTNWGNKAFIDVWLETEYMRLNSVHEQKHIHHTQKTLALQWQTVSKLSAATQYRKYETYWWPQFPSNRSISCSAASWHWNTNFMYQIAHASLIRSVKNDFLALHVNQTY